MHSLSVVHIEGSLRAPLNDALWHEVRALLDRGERRIVLDLARVPALDAAGVGELIRIYNMTIAANGVLRIAHANEKVEQILDRVGVFGLLSEARERWGGLEEAWR